MNYNVAFSGSDGNAVLVDNILFDIGISSNRPEMQTLLDKCVAVFISHRHSDHLNLTTYRYLCETRPFVKVFVNDYTANFIKAKTKGNHDNLVVVSAGDTVLLPNGDEITIYATKHEQRLLSTAYSGVTSGLETFMYATDFYDFNDLPQEKYDYVFVEANHDAKYSWYLKQIEELGGPPLSNWILKSTGRHTTKQEAFAYYEAHRTNEQSKFIPLHKSSRFYDMTDYKEKIDALMRGETVNFSD